jgi:hypothetical protein
MSTRLPAIGPLAHLRCRPQPPCKEGTAPPNRPSDTIVLISRLTDGPKNRIHLGMPKHFSLGAVALVALGTMVLQGGALANPPANGARKFAQATPQPSKRTAGKALYFDLRSYIKAVLAQDPGLIASRLGQMSNEKEAESLRAKYLPYLRGNATIGVQEGVNNFNLFGPSTVEQRVRNPDTGAVETVNVTRPIHTHGLEGYSILGPTLEIPFFKDGTFLGINTPPVVNAQRAQGQVLAATARLDGQEVAYRATDLFLQAIATSNEAKIMRDRFDWLQKQTDLIHEMARYNLASPADVQVADTKLEEAKIDVMIVGQRAVDAFLRTGELLGLDDPRLLRIDTKYPQAKPLPSFDSTVLRTNLGHPRVEMQQAEAKKADAELALKRAQLFPTGEIVSAYRFGNNLDDVGEPRWLSFLSINAPIFDFGRRYDEFKAADLKLQEEKELIAKAHQQVRQEVFDAFTHLREVLETQTAIIALVADRQRIVDRWEELNKNQTAPIPELLKAHIDLLDAKRSEEAVAYAVLVASAALEKATGGEWQWIR